MLQTTTQTHTEQFEGIRPRKPHHILSDLEILLFEFLASDLADCQETRNRMLVSFQFLRGLIKEHP